MKKNKNPIPKPDIQPAPRAKKSTSARDIRRARARRIGVRLAIWVGLPTLLATIYYGFLASPQYQSVAVFTVQSNKDTPTFDGLSAILATAGSGRGSLLVREYVHSRDMMKLLDERFGIIDHWRSTDHDWYSRLDADASSEEIYEYYRERVAVEAGTAPSTLVLRVRAFSPEKAQQVARGIIKASEAMVNKVTERARSDRLRVAEHAVAKSEKRLTTARKKLFALMGDHTVLDPKAAAAAVNSITVGLEAELAKARADLDSLLAIMKPTAPRVIAAKKKVGSLVYQLRRQRRRLVGDGTSSVKTSLADLEPAMVEKELAQRMYEASIKSLELARVEASRQVEFLVTIAEPSRPDGPTHPRRAWNITTVFVISLLLLGIGTLLIASVREHAKF